MSNKVEIPSPESLSDLASIERATIIENMERAVVAKLVNRAKSGDKQVVFNPRDVSVDMRDRLRLAGYTVRLADERHPPMFRGYLLVSW